MFVVLNIMAAYFLEQCGPPISVYFTILCIVLFPAPHYVAPISDHIVQYMTHSCGVLLTHRSYVTCTCTNVFFTGPILWQRVSCQGSSKIVCYLMIYTGVRERNNYICEWNNSGCLTEARRERERERANIELEGMQSLTALIQSLL